MIDLYAPLTHALPTSVEIIPAVLPRRFRDLTDGLAVVRGAAKRVQIDVVDGLFAHPKTWPYTDRVTFDAIVQEDHGLPFWDELDFEFDLMVEEPLAAVTEFIKTGASRIILHAHATDVLPAFQTLVDVREESGDFSIAVGVAMLPTDQPEVVEPFEAQFDFIQVMGIDHVGRQGEEYNPQAQFLVERLRHRYPQLPIQVDGGVRMENARALARAGANRLVVGSAIFSATDPLAALAALTAEANRT